MSTQRLDLLLSFFESPADVGGIFSDYLKEVGLPEYAALVERTTSGAGLMGMSSSWANFIRNVLVVFLSEREASIIASDLVYAFCYPDHPATFNPYKQWEFADWLWPRTDKEERNALNEWVNGWGDFAQDKQMEEIRDEVIAKLATDPASVANNEDMDLLIELKLLADWRVENWHYDCMNNPVTAYRWSRHIFVKNGNSWQCLYDPDCEEVLVASGVGFVSMRGALLEGDNPLRVREIQGIVEVNDGAQRWYTDAHTWTYAISYATSQYYWLDNTDKMRIYTDFCDLFAARWAYDVGKLWSGDLTPFIEAGWATR